MEISPNKSVYIFSIREHNTIIHLASVTCYTYNSFSNTPIIEFKISGPLALKLLRGCPMYLADELNTILSGVDVDPGFRTS